MVNFICVPFHRVLAVDILQWIRDNICATYTYSTEPSHPLRRTKSSPTMKAIQVGLPFPEHFYVLESVQGTLRMLCVIEY